MNVLLYSISYASVAVSLGLLAWASPRLLRLPALSRVLFGLASTPLVLAGLPLVLSLAWPNAPRKILLAGPAVAVLALALGRRRPAGLTLAAARRHLGRRHRPAAPRLVVCVAGLLLLAAAARQVIANAREPIDGHDALVYFTEARAFAEHPAWGTYLEMTNPGEEAALVRGHPHTWYYTSFIAPALAATLTPDPRAASDWVARLAVQANLLWLILSIGGLTWAIARRSAALTVAAMAATTTIPHIEYITVATSIDAFRLLPLVLLATALVGPRDRAGWRLAAVLTGLAAAAHTLNLVFAPLLILARVAAGLTRRQWQDVLRVFVPWTLLAVAPVAAHYLYAWSQTGRFFGNGFYYYFYTGSLRSFPLAEASQPGAPSLRAFFNTILETFGWIPTLVPLGCAAFLLILRKNSGGAKFLSFSIVLFWGAMVSGTVDGTTGKLSQMMLKNVRYPLATWLLGPPFVATLVGQACSAWPVANWRFALFKPWLGVLFAWAAVTGAAVRINQSWQLKYSPTEVLAQGEWRVAALIDRLVRPGEKWITDYNTVAYFVRSPSIFLYSPAGQQWINATDSSTAWAQLCSERVRIVALFNRDPDWWPSTAFYRALNDPEKAEKIKLRRWEVFVLKWPNPIAHPNLSGARASVSGQPDQVPAEHDD